MSKTDSVDNNRVKLIKDTIHLLTEVRRVFDPHSRAVWMDLDLTIGQLKSLFFIAHEGSTSLGKLAAALGVTPPNVTGIVERLVEQGLVNREENPENRRMLLLHLTAEGKKLMFELRESGSGQLTKMLNQFSDEDLKALAQGLAAIVRTAKPDITEKHRV